MSLGTRLGQFLGDASVLALTVALWEVFGPAGPIGYFAVRCALRGALWTRPSE